MYNYYYSEVFDTFEEAKKAQHEVLKDFISRDKAIRDCGLDWETDYDTKKQKFRVLVRHYLIEGEDSPPTLLPQGYEI